MALFSISRGLTSYKIDKGLIERLESYMRSELVPLSSPEQAAFPELYGLSIEDHVGVESLNTISEFRPAQFSDSTKQVSLTFNSLRGRGAKAERRVEVRLRFTRVRTLTELSITCSGENARERCVGIEDAIIQILAPSKTDSWLFHPGTFISALAFGFLFPFGTYIGAWYEQRNFVGLSSSAIVATLAIGYVVAGNKLKPWTSFESRAAKEAEEWWKWLKFGLATFLMFGVGLTLFRRRIFGF